MTLLQDTPIPKSFSPTDWGFALAIALTLVFIVLFGFWKIMNRHQDFVNQQLQAADKRAEEERKRLEEERKFRSTEVAALVSKIEESSRAERDSHQVEVREFFTRLDHRDETLRDIQSELRGYRGKHSE